MTAARGLAGLVNSVIVEEMHKKLGNSDMNLTPLGVLWAMGRRRLGVRVGAAGRQRIHGRYPRRARQGHQLDRYRRRLYGLGIPRRSLAAP